MKFENNLKSYSGDFLSPGDFFTVELVGKIICELKTGRAPGIDNLSTEHLLHCHPSAILLVTYICNLILLTGHVPVQMTQGVTYPLAKNKLGLKATSFDDFRGITVSSAISKILEKCILEQFVKYFYSADHQFGFKKGIGCRDAIFCLRSTVDHFVHNNSNANICSLDVAKAFDRVNQFSLLLKLMERLLPVNLILLLFNWFILSTACINWLGAISLPYRISAGVRQGGVLSPFLFAIYVNDVILSICDHGLGCHLSMQCVSIIMYADDVILISTSLSKLQLMIYLCIKEFRDVDLLVNPKKSACIRIGKKFKNELPELLIDNSPIPWSSQLVYLGITILPSSNFSVDLKPIRTKFYKSFNAIYGKVFKANEFLIVSLTKSFCLAVLMYSLEALILNNSNLRSLDNLLHNAFGKIFKTFDKNILSSCMYYMNTLTISLEYVKRRFKFLSKLDHSDNSIIFTWWVVNGKQELMNIINTIKLDDNNCNIDRHIWNMFSSSL